MQRLRRGLFVLSVVALGLLWFLPQRAARLYPGLRVPTHYDWRGRIDAVGRPQDLIGLAIVGSIVFAILEAVSRLELPVRSRYRIPEEAEPRVREMARCFLGLIRCEVLGFMLMNCLDALSGAQIVALHRVALIGPVALLVGSVVIFQVGFAQYCRRISGGKLASEIESLGLE